MKSLNLREIGFQLKYSQVWKKVERSNMNEQCKKLLSRYERLNFASKSSWISLHEKKINTKSVNKKLRWFSHRKDFLSKKWNLWVNAACQLRLRYVVTYVNSTGKLWSNIIMQFISLLFHKLFASTFCIVIAYLQRLNEEFSNPKKKIWQKIFFNPSIFFHKLYSLFFFRQIFLELIWNVNCWLCFFFFIISLHLVRM